ncbi:hypothetical protein [Candidatus Neomicrothrix sp.]|uniref:hypothetical protein n=1 Tax=Candidatus Neomicrothrix sp. TaxID=2719034 RepID=UPI001B595432|nr:hypothetical protein [Candidatus Microthrix sp.]MBP7989020.1 hypothetical protein [Candidatus Microthrix sp.]
MSSRVHGVAVWLVVPGMIFCAQSANHPDDSATVRASCELLLDVTDAYHRATEPINGRLVMKNLGREPIVIVKPLFPTVWHVRAVPDRSSGDSGQTWEGSVLVGTSDPGHARVYEASDYVTIASGKAYEQDIDVAWFLRNQRSSTPAGVYELQVWYRPHQQVTELRRDSASFAPEVASNVLRVVIIGEDE